VNAIGIPLRFDHTNNGMQIMAMNIERSIVEIRELAALTPAMTMNEAAIVIITFDAEILFLWSCIIISITKHIHNMTHPVNIIHHQFCNS
jgi:hypothetical protein